MLSHIRRKLATRRLKAMLKPDPDYARRRAAQLTGERRERFMRAVGLE